MGRAGNVVVALALVLPLATFVTVSVVAAAGDDPPPRAPIVLEIAPTSPTSDPTDRVRPPRPPAAPSTGVVSPLPTSDDDHARTDAPRPSGDDDRDDHDDRDDDDADDRGDD